MTVWAHDEHGAIGGRLHRNHHKHYFCYVREMGQRLKYQQMVPVTKGCTNNSMQLSSYTDDYPCFLQQNIVGLQVVFVQI